MRELVDFAAVVVAWAFVSEATDSNFAGGVAGALVAIYGAWCFYDGHASAQAKAQEGGA